VMTGSRSTSCSRHKKTAIQSNSGDGTAFMVAGARNRRYLHLDFASV
jgi:hypothetical protein